MNIVHRRNIAFVFYPYHPESIRLETMPFAMHALGKLADCGWRIDVFLWERENDPSYYERLFPENVRFKYIKLYSKRAKLNLIELSLRFPRYMAYTCVFSVGRFGSFVGRIISMASRCPFVLLNDEFPSCWDESILTFFERWSARHADVIVVPADDKHARLREELHLGSDKPFVTLRNSPNITFPLAQMDWHSLMGIPHGKRIFIHAGTVSDWAQVPEILASVNHWPADTVLLLHSKTRDGLERYKQQLSHMDNPERVFWSSEPLSEDMLNSLTGYCSGSFALYRNDGYNTSLMGTSSGKLMRSIGCGTPVITSSFKSLEFVTREGLGIQVNHPLEIPTAIENLEKDSENYRKRCLAFAALEEPLREEAWARIVDYVNGTSRPVDLSSPQRRRTMDRSRFGTG